jgi:hypothetical protein
MQILEYGKRLVMPAIMVISLCTNAGHAMTESYSLHYQVIGRAEQALKKAASGSQNWHRKQEAIERDVYDIIYFLDQTWKARERNNDAAMKDNAYQALTLLQRAIRRGHFDPAQVEPVLDVIRQLLPNLSV